MRSNGSRLLLAVVLVGVAVALAAVAGEKTADARVTGAVSAAKSSTERRLTRFDRLVVRKIVSQRNATWRWQDVMQRPRTPYSGIVEKTFSRSYRLWALRVWKARAKAAWRRAQRPPHYDEWLCIHRYEGSWTDPNAPYYGGLQMDLGFQRTYGGQLLERKGTADHWSPLEQMWVAERAHASGRGFYPWPNTARFCNLL